MTVTDPMIAAAFSARLDTVDLGMWTEVDLGGIEMTMEQREEGGDNLTVHQLPGRLKYNNIKLTRGVNVDTPKIGTWLRQIAGQVTRSNGEIVAYSMEGTRLLEWHFVGAVPVRWTIPPLVAGDSKAITESLEIAHQGFVQ
jgi:phage tail-like protein